MCMDESHRTICCFSCFESHNLLIRVYHRNNILYGGPILLTTWCETVTICWFWFILESTFCTVDPFCWHNNVCHYSWEKWPTKRQIETRQSKFLFWDRQDISWQIISPRNISQWNISWENILFKLYSNVMDYISDLHWRLYGGRNPTRINGDKMWQPTSASGRQSFAIFCPFIKLLNDHQVLERRNSSQDLFDLA